MTLVSPPFLVLAWIYDLHATAPNPKADPEPEPFKTSSYCTYPVFSSCPTTGSHLWTPRAAADSAPGYVFSVEEEVLPSAL